MPIVVLPGVARGFILLWVATPSATFHAKFLDQRLRYIAIGLKLDGDGFALVPLDLGM